MRYFELKALEDDIKSLKYEEDMLIKILNHQEFNSEEEILLVRELVAKNLEIIQGKIAHLLKKRI